MENMCWFARYNKEMQICWAQNYSYTTQQTCCRGEARELPTLEVMGVIAENSLIDGIESSVGADACIDEVGRHYIDPRLIALLNFIRDERDISVRETDDNYLTQAEWCLYIDRIFGNVDKPLDFWLNE